jgi:DNA repair protein RadC
MKERDHTFTVHDLPKEERPRERLQRFGPDKLSSPELLALVIGRGVSGRSVMNIAQELIARFGSVAGVSEATIEELSSIKGIGSAKAAQLKAAMELGKRQERKVEPEYADYDIRNPEAVAKLARTLIKDKAKEHFLLVTLSTRNKVTGIHKISVGTLNTSLVHPREVFKEAIRRSASSVVLAHNHPSGDTEPSEEDLKITRRLLEAGKLLGIEVLDHVIVTENKYLSFKEKGLI